MKVNLKKYYPKQRFDYKSLNNHKYSSNNFDFFLKFEAWKFHEC